MSFTQALSNEARQLRRPVLLAARISALLSLRRQRRDLVMLGHDRLADLGLTPDQAWAEASRPVWDVPAHWRR